MSEIDELVGKTVCKVTRYGDGYLELEFTDGSRLEVGAAGTEEQWLIVDYQR
jgi:hypothetical protein